MFKSKRVGCFLSTFAGHGDDTDNKELKLVFFVSPISQMLAEEISPLLADRLFRRNDLGWEPAREITKASFSSISVPLQNIEFHELPDADAQQSSSPVQGAAISNLRASRAAIDSSDFRLEFDVVIPMDGITMRLVEKFYKATCYLTMESAQREIPYSNDSKIVEIQMVQSDEPADGKSAAAGKDGDDISEIGAPKTRRKKGAA